MSKTKTIAERSEEFLRPIISNLGYNLVAVDYEKKQNGYNLTVYIDTEKEGGISLDDCEIVHHAIDDPLDELNPTNDAPYTLNVSSCGLDWAFRTNADYQKNIGNMVDVSLYAPVNRKKNHTGILKAYNDDSVTILAKEELTLPRKSISKICKHIDF